MSEELIRRREQIKRDRDELGRTVQALAHKVDVPARTRDAVASAKLRVHTAARGYGADELRWGAVAGAGTVAVLGATWLALRRRHPDTH